MGEVKCCKFANVVYIAVQVVESIPSRGLFLHYSGATEVSGLVTVKGA